MRKKRKLYEVAFCCCCCWAENGRVWRKNRHQMYVLVTLLFVCFFLLIQPWISCIFCTKEPKQIKSSGNWGVYKLIISRNFTVLKYVYGGFQWTYYSVMWRFSFVIWPFLMINCPTMKFLDLVTLWSERPTYRYVVSQCYQNGFSQPRKWPNLF